MATSSRKREILCPAAPALLSAARALRSEAARARLGQPERRAYGATEIEKLDLFRTKRANAPVFIFIHGGAWLRGSASDYHFYAENFITAGAHYIAVDFIQATTARCWCARQTPSSGSSRVR